MPRLDEGESFVGTRHGVPVGEPTPLRRLRFVTADSIAQLFQAAPPTDAEQFRRDLDRINVALPPSEVAVTALTVAELAALEGLVEVIAI